jgi:hypothetical protein
MKLAPVTGVLEVASCAPPPAKRSRTA